MRLPSPLHRQFLAAAMLAALPALALAGAGPVIDMHVHAYALDVPPGAPACPGDRAPPVPTVDPREELDFSKMGS